MMKKGRAEEDGRMGKSELVGGGRGRGRRLFWWKCGYSVWTVKCCNNLLVALVDLYYV